ncbi:MAG: Rha family transcriptional regulator [Thiotrichaceae bacterium]
MIYSPSPQIEIIDGVAVTTSLAIAGYFDKRHDNVIVAIRDLQLSDSFRNPNFRESKYTPEGQTRSYPMYYLTKNGFFFLVMGFTGEEAGRIKEAYINAFDQMEKYLREHAQSSHFGGANSSHWTNHCMELQEELLQLYRKQLSPKRPRRRLTIDAIWEIRLLHEQGFDQSDISEFTGHDESTVAFVVKQQKR